MPSFGLQNRSPHYPKLLNTLGDDLCKRRLDLGLLQSEAASRIGVVTATITNWEGNKSSPELRYIPAVLRFLGYNPIPRGETFAARLFAVRKVLGLSQRPLATILGVDPATLQDWETGRHQPIRRNVQNAETVLRGLKAKSFGLI
jgi:transcriptional regulator with XRE-family HTH domain